MSDATLHRTADPAVREAFIGHKIIRVTRHGYGYTIHDLDADVVLATARRDTDVRRHLSLLAEQERDDAGHARYVNDQPEDPFEGLPR